MALDADDWALGAQDRHQDTVLSSIAAVIVAAVLMGLFLGLVALALLI